MLKWQFLTSGLQPLWGSSDPYQTIRKHQYLQVIIVSNYSYEVSTK